MIPLGNFPLWQRQPPSHKQALRGWRSVFLLWAFVVPHATAICYDAASAKRTIIVDSSRKTNSSRVFWLVCAIGFSDCSNRAIHPPALFPVQATANPYFVDAIQKIKRSITPIVCFRVTDGRAELISVEGTGFFVASDGTFVTADHVIAGIANTQKPTPCPYSGIYLPQSGGWNAEQRIFEAQFYGFSVSDCRRDPDLDIASCKSRRALQEGHGILPVAFQPLIQPDGTPIAFTGFPLQYHIPLSSVGTISGYAEARVDNRGPRDITIDKAAWPGASGSPIYTIDGKVVGLLRQRGINDGSGRAIGTPSRLIQEFLAQTAPAQ